MGRHLALASRIRELRLSTGYTQQDLSQASGLSRSYISRLEMGDIALPSRDKLRALATSLGTSLDDLLHAAGFLDAPTDDEGLPEIKTYLKHKYAIYDPNALQAIDTLVQLLSRRSGDGSTPARSAQLRPEEQPDRDGKESTPVD